MLPQPWPPSQTPTQAYQTPSYISNPPAVIPIDLGRQLFVDDFLVQQTTMTRTQHQPVMYPLNPILAPSAFDTAGSAMPFSDGVWFDPADQLFKMWFYCGNGDQVCYAYSMDGKNWIRPSIPDAAIPNTDVVLQAAPTDPPFAGLIVWMDLQDPTPGRKFKAFLSNSSSPALLYFSADGIHWTATITSQYPLPLFDRTTFFWNPFRNVWVDSYKVYTTLPSAPGRPAYLGRARDYLESTNLTNWTPAQPQNSSFWTGPDVNDPPYVPGGSYPELYNLDAVGYESLMVGMFSWFYPGNGDSDDEGLPGPDLVELGVGFSRDGFQWVRPTRGSGPGTNGAFIPASNTPGTWNMGNTQSAGGGFLVVGDELWFYFSGRNGLHGNPSAMGSTGLATLRRDGFYSMDAGSASATLTTRPVQFSGKYLFVNVKDPQASLQVQVLNPSNGSVLATSLPFLSGVDKTLQAISWSGLADLSSFANQPVKFRFTLTNGQLYSFWVSASPSGASNGFMAANGPGFTGPTDSLGIGAYPTTVATPQIYPAGGLISSNASITITTSTVGAVIHYTLDGSTPTISSPAYIAPFQFAGGATVKAIAAAPGLTTSAVASANFTVDSVAPTVSLIAPTNGQILSAAVVLSANASDPVGVANVQFTVDGAVVAQVSSVPYTFILQTTTLTNATHQIAAIATDTVGNKASAAVTVTVNNVINGGPTAGLVGYWSLDSNYVNGTTLFDQSGDNNNATVVSPVTIYGKVGQALLFNGSTSYAQVPSSLSTTVYDLVGDLSLSLWVQTLNSSRYEAVISKYAAGGSGSGYILRTTPAGTAELVLGIENVSSVGNVATDVTRINDGTWHNIAVVIKLGATVTFYVDGALSSTQTIPSTAGTAASFFQMGLNPYAPYGTYFTGNMDEVRVYNRALSAGDVTSLYNVPANPPPPPAAAVFLNADTTTRGNWKSMYGQEGYIVASDSNNQPSYAGVNFPGAGLYVWNSSTSDPRALLKAGSGTDRIASTYFATGGFSIDVNLTDGQTHQVELYALDWENAPRTETLSLLDANTGIVLDHRSVTSFSSGQYLKWNLTGHVLINVTSNTGPNAVVSGVFFGGALGPDLTISLASSGAFQQGDAADTYSITVTNIGAVATNGTVSVAETVPSALSATGISGVGWSCVQPAGPCSRNDVLNVGASYPPITLTVSIPTGAPSSVTNIATVSGGGEANLTNDIATAVTTITSVSSAPSFLTAYALNSPVLRNDFSGWVGMKITVGVNTLSIASIGRVCNLGNSGTHIAKFVSASTGTDVPGGAVLLNMAGCTLGQFVYGAPAGSFALQPNAAYYLVSQEVAGGDKWLDRGTIASTSDATVNSSAYSPDGLTWSLAGAVNTSYVPDNFQYTVIPTVLIPVSVQANPAAAAFIVDGTTYSLPQAVNWPSGSPHTLAVVSPQNGAPGIQYAWNGWSDGGAISHTVSPTSATSFTAAFTTRYSLTAGVSASTSGSITMSPSSPTGYYDSGTTVQVTAASNTGCTFVSWSGDVSGSSNPLPVTMAAPHTVTANFQCGPPPVVFVTAYALNNPRTRNDFTGWVGMKLIPGANPLNVSAIGRVCVAGNSGTHTVKFVNADTGIDVPGGSASLSMSGCAAGQFVYSTPASPFTLQANTAYYLVSHEVGGGDLWYEFGTVSAANDAAVTSSVYSGDSSNWGVVNLANTSYVPPNFIYSVTSTSTLPVTVQASPSAASFTVDGTTYTTAQTFNWTSGSPHTLTAASPQSGAAGIQYVWSSWSDNGGLSHTVSPTSATAFTANFTTAYLLTTSVSPSNGGGIGASPSSANGYYTSGTSVQLTANPNSGCTFTGWSGDGSGTSNPLPVTMSAAHTVTANFQCGISQPTTFVTTYGLTGLTPRNNFSGWAGMKLTTGANYLSVSSVGRACVAGNSAVHIVKFVSASTGTDVPGGSASVNMSGCVAGQFVFSALTSPITLQANAAYYLASQEVSLTDQWNDTSALLATADASVTSSIYSPDSVTWVPASAANTSYVPPNFQYSVVPPPPDLTITKTHLGTLTQGDIGDAYVITVTNSGVSATTGTVSVTDTLPTGVTATAISGVGWSCTQPAGPCSRIDPLNGGTSYPTLSVTVNVAANAPVSVINTATVSGGGEINISNNTATDTATVAPNQVTVTIQTSLAGLSFSVDGTAYSTTQIFNWTSGSSHSIALTTPQSGGAGVQYVWSSWSDAGAISHTVSPTSATTFTATFNPQYSLTAAASPAAGGSVNPASGWYNSGAVVAVSAATSNGFQFTGFTGGTLSGTSTPQNVTMNGPVTVTANFVAVEPVTVTTAPPGLSLTVDGGSCNTPCLFQWTQGSNHTIAVVTTPQAAGAGVQYAFGNWSDNGVASHSITVPASAITYTANFAAQYLLTSAVSPAGSGGITPNPPSATGYYNSGSVVQLTPAPSSGYVFLNWSGDLGGTTSQQTVTMSAPHTVTANFQAVISGITGYALNGPPLRNNFSGWVGMQLTVGQNSLSVATLGRICVPGNSGTHPIKFVNASTGTDVSGGSVSLNMSGCVAGQFVYTALANPIVLPASTSYYLVSQEVLGGDQWYDFGGVSSTTDAAVKSAVYFDGANWIPVSTAGNSYVPPNFQYWTISNTSLITSYTLNNGPARNNFTGWVGMKFTVGASGLPVNSLGRLFLAGNSGTHTIKLVRASDGSDVPGGSVSLSMAGGTPGGFSYAQLPSQITLSPSTAYYLVSQETAGGDQWYDFGPVTTSGAAAVNNAVYFMNGAWSLVGGPNTSYVPPNLK